ncbi:MAG: VOC family protein [Jatrophihabitans sp.]|uniref:VOC family protein n=1 Tax=Jatrophihabitans sp. TaxID=1932789 RepID=UPI003F81DD64
MVTRDTPWPPGYPCWVDLTTSDIDAASEFYRGLFGWELLGSGPEFGGYVIAQVGGLPVAGLGPQQPGMEGHPSVWTTYLATDDADATAAAVREHGGVVVAEPFDVGPLGRMAVVQDPTGGTFGLWQAAQHYGARRTNETGALMWNELMTHDYERAQAFYGAVFGFTFEELGGGDYPYSAVVLDGRPVAGLGVLAAEAPKEVPPHWRVYFAVDDADDALSRAQSLGGVILRAAEDMPYGRWGDLSDGQGAMFAVIKPAPAPE